MKPTPQLDSSRNERRSLPLSDYRYHSALDSARAVTEHEAEVRESRAFWKMSSEVFAAKTSAEYVRELLAFAAIGALSAWPIFVALHAVTRMVRGY